MREEETGREGENKKGREGKGRGRVEKRQRRRETETETGTQEREEGSEERGEGRGHMQMKGEGEWSYVHVAPTYSDTVSRTHCFKTSGQTHPLIQNIRSDTPTDSNSMSDTLKDSKTPYIHSPILTLPSS